MDLKLAVSSSFYHRQRRGHRRQMHAASSKFAKERWRALPFIKIYYWGCQMEESSMLAFPFCTNQDLILLFQNEALQSC